MYLYSEYVSLEYNTIAERVAQGSMRQLRDQVIMDFKHINRRYRDKFDNGTLLHIICQEGFYDMAEFLLDEKNHTSFDKVPIEVNAQNDRRRTAFLLCFTPPSLTYLGQRYGIDGQTGIPKSERPDGIEVIGDWIKPGGPRVREKIIQLVRPAVVSVLFPP